VQAGNWRKTDLNQQTHVELLQDCFNPVWEAADDGRLDARIRFFPLVLVHRHGRCGGLSGGRILNRIGFSPLWAILMFIPLLNLIGLWILAFSEWPGGSRDEARNPSPPI
jgi:hypothetical protein